MRAQPNASHYIAGKFTEDASGEPLESVYPASGEVIARLHCATPALIDRAVDAARAAQPAWAALKPVERGRMLRLAADILRARNQEISEIETLDTGKAIQETLVADPASAADTLEFMGGAVAAFNGEHIDLGGPFAYTKREAIGVCAGIGAWNYPIQGAAWKSAPALAMGNAFIFKPSENTPLSALALAQVYEEAGLPAGLFSVVQGRGDVGSMLVDRQDFADRLGADWTESARYGGRADEARDDGTRRQVAFGDFRGRRS
jgi:betaine-aldehyde dehydrogenase